MCASGWSRCGKPVTHRPHDLLWLADAASLVCDDALPAWASSAWLAQAPLVVRRALPRAAHLLPVGLRGRARHQRCAAWLPAAQVQRAVSPEAVLHGWQRDGGAQRAAQRGLPLPAALQALDELARAWHALPLAWGVTGSVGFTLASGIAVLRDSSDLDLLVRTPAATDAPLLRALAPALQRCAARVDVQVETPVGAFALLEWLRTGGAVLLKTDHGPLLSDDAWRPVTPPATP